MTTTSRKPFSTGRTLLWMLQMALHTRKRVLIFCLLTASLNIIYQLAQLYIAPQILACVELHKPISTLLYTIVFFTTILFCTQGLLNYLIPNTVFARVDVRSEINARINRKAMQTSFPNTLDLTFKKKLSKATQLCSSNDVASEHIWETLTLLLTNIVGFILLLKILSVLHPLLIALVILTCLLSFFASKYATDWSYRHREEQEEYYQKKYYLRNRAESLRYAKDIRLFGLQPWLNEIILQMHDLYYSWLKQSERVYLWTDVAALFLTILRNAAAYLYLMHRTLQEGLPVSQFLLYFTAISTFTEWVIGILQQGLTLYKELLDIHCIRELLNYPEPFAFEAGLPIPQTASYEIMLDHVSYRYPETDSWILRDICCTIRPGEKLAIVGLNGAGKTTWLKLVCGLLDPTEGAVRLNGIDIRTYNRRSYYRLFSAVFQEYSLLDVTIAETITQSPDPDDSDRIWDCIDRAGLKDKVEQFPQGIDTHIGREVYLDGVLLSGGETQKLLLARALYRDAPLLVLDEPTAALDPIAESNLYQKYNALCHGKTSLFISHRLASTQFCDRILLLENAGIAEEGTHEELIALGGTYAHLFAVQSRYYRDSEGCP